MFLFEFKFNDTAQNALEQIKTQAYFEKYKLNPKPTTLFGVAFVPSKRGIGEWVKESRAT